MITIGQFVGWILIGFLGGWIGVKLWIDSGATLVALPALTWLFPLILAIIVLVLAWPVRAMSQGKTRALNPLVAARIAILCSACSRGGALIAGLCLGGWVAFDSGHAVFLQEQSARALWAGLSSLALAGAGWLGEYWCSIDDDDEEPLGAQGAA